MADSDSTLVRRALEGDADAYGDLVERYLAHLHGIILEIVRQPDAVEDLVQDVLCATYQQLATLRDPDRFAAWLRTVAVNRAHDWQRRQQVKRDLGTQAQIAQLYRPNSLPDEMAARQERDAALWEAMDHLAPELRRVLVLHYIEGCPIRSTARFLGVSATTVKFRLRRARHLLKSELMAEYLAGHGASAQTRRRLKRAVMVALPTVPFWSRPAKAAWASKWWERLAVLVSGASMVGLLAMGWGAWTEGDGSARWPDAPGGMRARLGEVEVPRWAMELQPVTAQPGELLQVAARSADGMAGAPPVLHWVQGARDEQDQVVEMVAEGDQWVARIDVPPEAKALFLYVSSEEREPLTFDRRWPQSPRVQRQLRKYSRSILLRGDDGRPVRGAWATRASMTALTDSSLATAVEGYETETRLYPDNLQAFNAKWNLLGRTDPTGDWRREAAREQEWLARDLADSTWLIGWQLSTGTLEPEEAYEKARQAQAGDAHRVRVARMAAKGLRERQEHDRAAAILRRELATGAPTLHAMAEVALRRQYLELLREADPRSALAAADSLVTSAVAAEATWYGQPTVYSWGTTLAGWALTFRVEIHRSAGASDEIRRDASRVLRLERRDPVACLWVGRVLAGQAPVWQGEDALTRTRADSSLAMELFRRGLEAPQTDPIAGALHEALSRCLLNRGRAEEAVEHGAAAVAPQETLPWHERDPAPYMALGEALEELGRWRAAKAAYLRAIEPNQTCPEAEEALRRVMPRLAESETAAEAIDRVHPGIGELKVRDGAGDEIRLCPADGPLLLYYAWQLPGEPLGAGAREHLTALQRQFEPDGLRVVAVAGGVLGQVEYRQSLAADPMPFPVIVDDGQVYDALEPRPCTLYLLDGEGRVQLRTPTPYRWERVDELVRHCLQRLAETERAARG